jgi:2-polyprenyl-3-methyl-5-hydroxy-6-metoxy-1,4-benzoquinol methylase
VALRPLPRPTEHAAHTEQSYAAGAYAVFTAADRIRDAIARQRFEIVRRVAPPGAWLDVGCSSGAFVAVARAAGVDILGLERSDTAVAQARARDLPVEQGTVETFVPTRRPAVVTAFDVVEHLADPLAFVRRAVAWLAPGGVFVATVPNLASLTARLMGRHWFYYAPPDHVHYFDPATIRRLLESAGLGAIEIGPASKALSPEYAALALAQFNRRLGAIARVAVRFFPRRLRARVVPIRVGELLAIARAPQSDAGSPPVATANRR